MTLESLQDVADATGLEAIGENLQGPSIQVRMYTPSRGRTVVTYGCQLPTEGMPDLILLREGADSATEQARGHREITVGDVDFDDMFWVQTQDPGGVMRYLTPDRRKLLMYCLELFPEAQMLAGKLQGTFYFDDYQGIKDRIEAFQELQRCLSQPPPQPDRPAGWYTQRQLLLWSRFFRKKAYVVVALQVILLLLASHSSNRWWLLSLPTLLVLTGLSLFTSGVLPRRGRLARKLGQLTFLVMVGWIVQVDMALYYDGLKDPGLTAVFGGFLTLLGGLSGYLNALAFSRLRLEPK